MKIVETVPKEDYLILIEIWEASVRATHQFLKEEDIVYFKPLILEKYFDAVTLAVVKDEHGKIKGFSGVAENSLEMLFIDPLYFGQGLGKQLLQHAIEKARITLVDVNEDNQQALRFYEKQGFEIFDRSATDPTGKPYPILHMRLKSS
ncbi:MAG: GNAT family N-acetyltransferase [Bacteroidota bacterium]